MSDHDRLEELLLDWEKQYEQGRDVPAAELCRNCPELACSLEGEIAKLKHLRQMRLGSTVTYEPTVASVPGIPFGGVRYRPLRFHAAGGLGEVYLARDEELGREVALKRIQARVADSAACRQRFVCEAEITGRLEHPGVVPVYGLGVDASGQPYYAMRFIRGESLKDAIDALHKESGAAGSGLRPLLQRLVAMCNATAYAHSRGVVHRDLKPANVMLGKYGETLVVDWGLAKVIGRPDSEPKPDEDTSLLSSGEDVRTLPGQALGTPGYMSPEQAAGCWGEVGPASDIFSLGATLYHLLTGRPPYVGLRTLEAVRQGHYERPRKLDRRVAAALEAICLKAMARQPVERYATALDLARDVERWLADEPVTAYREPLSTRLRRWGRRHRTAVAVGVALLGAAVVALTLSTFLIRRQQLATLAAKERADRNFVLAREAVEKTITQVAGHRRLKEADFQGLRKQLLASAVPFYEEFVRQQSDDPAVENDRGKALMQLAYVRDETGDKEAALADYGTALSLFARLAEQFPAVPEYRQQAAKSYHDRGLLLAALGRRDEAEKEYHAALALEEKLAEQFPDVPEHLFAVANSHNNLGLLLQHLGRLDESELEYRAALKSQETLAEQFAAMPDYRQEVARSRMNLGNLLTDLGRRSDAEKEFRAALSRQEKLVEQFPAVPDYRQELALTHNNLGVLLGGLGRRSEQEKEHRAAIALQEKLAEQFPAVPAYRQDLGRSHMNFGNLLRDLGHSDEAENESRSAFTLQEKLVEQFPSIPEYRHDLASSHNQRATQLHLQGRRDEAEKEYRSALANYEKLTEQFSAAPAYAVDLAGCYVNFGALLREQGKVEDALAWYARAMATLQGVLAKDQRHATARLYLRNAYYNRAQAWDQLRRYTDAAADWQRAAELDEGRDRPYFRLQQAASLIRAGDHARAVAEINGLTEGKYVPGGLYYDSACICARAAAAVKDNTKLAEQYAGRAVTLLREAEKAGLFKDPAPRNRLAQDKDLDSLRQRSDFKELLQQLGLRSGKP